jgi:hypothetical protein|nr:hypothetical protein [Phocaeicola vulgatus]
MIDNYGIGGNEKKNDVSEGIADIPQNRTILAAQLTKDESISPEIIEGLTKIEDVFEHFKPEIDIEFSDAEGRPVEENFQFHNVGDFSVNKITEQSKFLSGLNTEKEFSDRQEKALRNNKVLQRILDNPETRKAYINLLDMTLQELKNNEKSNAENKE